MLKRFLRSMTSSHRHFPEELFACTDGYLGLELVVSDKVETLISEMTKDNVDKTISERVAVYRLDRVVRASMKLVVDPGVVVTGDTADNQ